MLPFVSSFARQLERPLAGRPILKLLVAWEVIETWKVVFSPNYSGPPSLIRSPLAPLTARKAYGHICPPPGRGRKECPRALAIWVLVMLHRTDLSDA